MGKLLPLSPVPLYSQLKELLRGRSLKDIEGEIEKFWQGNGLRVEFRN